MDSAIAALTGASIGASAGVVGVLLTNWLQTRAEHRRWLRDRKVQAYADSLRHLYRLANRRARVLAASNTGVKAEQEKEWFDDYISTVESLGTLAIVSPREFDQSIREYAVLLRSEFEAHLRSNQQSGLGILSVPSFTRLTETLEDELVEAAKRDLGVTS